MKSKIRKSSHAGQKKEHIRWAGNLKSVLAIILGLMIAICGFLFPNLFFSNESRMLVGNQNTVDVSSSDSVQAVVRDLSFTLEDYAYITEMTMSSGAVYYSEPTEAQLSMREAVNAAGEILKALLPNIFTGDVRQSYTLTSAILASNIQSSEEDYDYRQCFWYVDVSYPDNVNDVTLTSAINSVNGRAWTVTATFPMSGDAYDSYGIRVAEDIVSDWGVSRGLFYTENSENVEAAYAGPAEYVPVHAQESDETETALGDFSVEYLTDEGVLVYNASGFWEALETTLQTFDGLKDFAVDLYENYMDYLGLSEDELQNFSAKVLYEADSWYSEALEDCRELMTAKADLQAEASAAETNGFARMYAGNDNDTILLTSEAYEKALIVMTQVVYSYGLNVSLVAEDETSGLEVTVTLQIVCDEEFTIAVSLGMESVDESTRPRS